MKKALAWMLVIALCALLAACGQNSKTADEKATEAVATADQAETEAPAETAPTEEGYTVVTSSAHRPEVNENGTFSYTDKKYGFTVDIPAIWNEYGYIAENDETGALMFCHEKSRFSDDLLGGWVFSIAIMPIGDDGGFAEDDPCLLLKNSEYDVFWEKPTDVQYLEEYRDEYSALNKTVISIVDTARW